MTTFIWASVHTPTKEQLAGLLEMGKVLFLKDLDSDLLRSLSNMQLDTDIIALAVALEDIRKENKATLVQPAGSPAFQRMLGIHQAHCVIDYDLPQPEEALTIYAFSERVSEDVIQNDGSVKKVSIFKHLGWC